MTDVPVLNSLDSLLKEIDVLSTAVEYKFTTVVLSNIDCDTVLDHDSGGSDIVMTDADFIVSPLSVFLESTDLAGQHFLLHPACGDLFACLQHYHACKKSDTSAVIVLPKQPGVWRKYVRDTQLLKDSPCSDVLFVPCDDEALGKHAVQVYYDSPVVTDSVCAVVGSLGLTMQFEGTVSGAPASVLMDSCCTNSLMSAAYARRMGITVEQGVGSSLQVAVANGMVCSSHGTCKVRLKLQQFSADLTCHVVELADAYEVILGEDWLGNILLLCLGATNVVCLPRVARGSR